MTNYEYLIFNLLVITGPILVMLLDHRSIKVSRKPLMMVYLFASLPFIFWDAVVAGKWWYFNPAFVLGVNFGPLPMEEILFFFTVPFATLFLWVNARHKLASNPIFNSHRQKYQNIFLLISLSLSLLGIFFLLAGHQYTVSVLLLPLFVLIVGRKLNTQLFTHNGFWGFQLAVVGLNLLTNTYLTARPIITYNPATMLNIRVGTIPIEDFLFGFGLIALSQLIYSKSSIPIKTISQV